MNELPFLELIRERIYKFSKNCNNLLWRQEKLVKFFGLFGKCLDIYLDNRAYLKENPHVAKQNIREFNIPDD